MRYTFSIILLFACVIVHSQSGRIIGKIVDTTNAALDHASVIVLDQADSSMLYFAQSDKQGNFSIDQVSSGKYLLQLSYTGFLQYWKKIEVHKDEELQLGNIILQTQNYLLPVMEIKGEHSPIKFGRDTVEYNASSFKTQSGDVVEDLLKKLPGIEVDRDGSVKAYGEKVQNVLVDGKEFFGKDTKIATKNLEADAVDKVQVFDKKSDQAAFTGVDDGREEKTINLQLKEDKKNGYFGNANGGAGTKERYSAKANLNRFSAGSRFSFIGTANNINEQGFSIQEYIDFMGGIGAFMSGGGGRVKIELNDNSGIPLQGSGQVAGIQNSTAGGINYSKDLSEKTELTGSFFHNSFNNTLSDQVYRQNINVNSIFNTSEDKQQYSKSNSQSINLYLKHKLDSTQNLIFRLNGSRSDLKLDNALHSSTFETANSLINENRSNYHLEGNNDQINASLSWLKKLGKPGRSLVSRLSGKWQNNQRDGRLMSQTYYYLFSNIPDSILQRQDLNDKAMNYEGSISYTEPLGRKKYTEFNYMHSNFRHQTKNDYFDITDNQIEFKNDLLSKAYESNYSYNSAGFNFLINKKKYHFTAGMKLQYSSLNGTLQNVSGNAITKDYRTVLPAVFGEYQLGPAHHINFDYQTTLQEPSIEQLQPTTNNSDPLNTYKGNPDLNPEYIHELNATYFLYDQFNFTSLFASLNASYTQDRITEIVDIDSAFRRVIQPVNVPFDKSIRAGIDFSTPIRPLKINARIRLASGISSGILYVNEEKNEITRLKHNLNFSLENRNKDILDLLVGWKYSDNKTNYSISTINNQQFNETALYADFTLTAIHKFTLKSNFEYHSYRSSFFKENLVVPLWEISISRFFLKDNKLKLQLKIFDVLNENKGIRRTSQLNYIQEEHSNVLGRYAMLQIGYAIRGFSSGKKNGIEINLER